MLVNRACNICSFLVQGIVMKQPPVSFEIVLLGAAWRVA